MLTSDGVEVPWEWRELRSTTLTFAELRVFPFRRYEKSRAPLIDRCRCGGRGVVGGAPCACVEPGTPVEQAIACAALESRIFGRLFGHTSNSWVRARVMGKRLLLCSDEVRSAAAGLSQSQLIAIFGGKAWSELCQLDEAGKPDPKRPDNRRVAIEILRRS